VWAPTSTLAADPRIREADATQHIAFGEERRPGEVHLALPFAPQFCQQNGFLHAGAIASVADSANGYAAYTLAPPESDVLAVEFKINLLAPARGDGFLACGRVLRPGRTLTVCQAEVITTGTNARTLIATMLSTIIVRPMERGARAGA
jgi:uncharacterized protein (TIGR00369 family)